VQQSGKCKCRVSTQDLHILRRLTDWYRCTNLNSACAVGDTIQNPSFEDSIGTAVAGSTTYNSYFGTFRSWKVFSSLPFGAAGASDPWTLVSGKDSGTPAVPNYHDYQSGNTTNGFSAVFTFAPQSPVVPVSGGISQFISVCPGVNYSVAFDLKVNPSTGTTQGCVIQYGFSSLQLQTNSTPIAVAQTNTSSYYTLLSTDYNVTAWSTVNNPAASLVSTTNGTYVQVLFSCPSTQTSAVAFYLDNFRLNH
jgi:hypothetical protein